MNLRKTKVVALSALTKNQYNDLSKKFKNTLFDEFSKSLSTDYCLVEKPVDHKFMKELIDSLQ